MQQLTSLNNQEVNPSHSTNSRRTRKRSRTVPNYPHHHLVRLNPRSLSTPQTHQVDPRTRMLNLSHRGKLDMDLPLRRLRQHRRRRCIRVGRRRGKRQRHSKRVNPRERRLHSTSFDYTHAIEPLCFTLLVTEKREKIARLRCTT